MTNEAQVKQTELAFAAEYGDGSALWARLQKLATSTGYRVELAEPDQPITCYTPVEFHLLPGCPQLLPFDPHYEERILAAAAMVRRWATEQTHLTGSRRRSNAAKRARSNTALG